MAFKLDLNRLKEVFYSSVSEPSDTAIEKFIKCGLEYYMKRYLTANQAEVTKNIKFSKPDSDCSMVMQIFGAFGLPDLSGITISGYIPKHKVTTFLHGHTVAEFSELQFSDLPITLTKEEKKIDNCLSIGLTNFHFSQDPSRSDIVKKIVSEDSELNVNLAICCLEAKRISVQNPFYENDDKDDNLIRENVVLTKATDKRFFTQYSIKTVSETLPETLLIRLKDVFELMYQNFDKSFFKGISVEAN